MRAQRDGAPHSRRTHGTRPEPGHTVPGPVDPRSTASLLRLQRSIGNAAVGAMLDEERSPVHDVISSAGAPLGSGIRAEMEARLGADFSDVRIHTDEAAAASARSVQAHAYTIGSNVAFGRGQYDPNSQAGKTMLAHELTHVTQQRAGQVEGAPAPGGIRLSDPSDRFERAASANAERVMATSIPTPERTLAPDGGPVQREWGDEEGPRN